MTAVDGRIDCAMTEQLPGVQEYYSMLDSLAAPSERVSRDYLAYLGGLHISWIACGKERGDLARACEILASAFGVERMAVVGGGHINTALPAAGQALARRQGRQLVLTYRRRGSRRGLPQRVVRARQRRGI